MILLGHFVTSVMESIDENCSCHATWEGQLVINNQDLGDHFRHLVQTELNIHHNWSRMRSIALKKYISLTLYCGPNSQLKSNMVE